MTDQHTVSPVPARPLRILVTGAGGPAGLSLIRSYLSAGHDVFAADMDVHSVGLHLVWSGRRLIIPRGDAAEFGSRVLALCRLHSIDVVIPTVDAELLPISGRRHDLIARGTQVVLANERTLSLCLDKLALSSHCTGLVPTPRSEAFTDDFDPATWSFPVIAKPRTGSGGRGVRLVHEVADLHGLPHTGAYMIQAYLPGAEYSVDVFADQNGVTRAAVPRERLRVDSGVAIAARTVHDADLEQYSRLVAGAIGLQYVANVQFRRADDGRPQLIEVNPRFPGTMPLTVAAGVDMPKMAVQACLGRTDWRRSYGFSDVGVVRHWEEIFVEPGRFEIGRVRPELAERTMEFETSSRAHG